MVPRFALVIAKSAIFLFSFGTVVDRLAKSNTVGLFPASVGCGEV